MKYCVKCVFSSISATPLTFDEEGVCSGCRASNLKDKIDRSKKLSDLHDKPIKMAKYEKETKFPVLRVNFDGRIIIIDRSHIARYEE